MKGKTRLQDRSKYSLIAEIRELKDKYKELEGDFLDAKESILKMKRELKNETKK